MKTLINALREVYGLFVEDASYTLALLIWLLLVAFVLPHLFGPRFLAPILFAGLALFCSRTFAGARKR